MNLYSKKLRWKIILMFAALIIVGGTIWYASHIASKVQNEERQKVELWSEAIRKKADLVNVTNQAFDALAEQERKKIEFWARATKEMEKDLNDYSFALEIITGNKDIPLILTDENDVVSSSSNLEDMDQDSLNLLVQEWGKINPPIEIKYSGNRSQKIYFRNSDKFFELQWKRDSLIEAFNHDLVENEALVPVIFIDANTMEVIATNLEPEEVDSREEVDALIQLMKSENAEIEVKLDEDHSGAIYFQESMTLKQLRYYPYIMLSIITIFLFIGYLLFSTFRRAEQNQVWVGMAKETAHQLGTPLSSLMAWLEILRSQGVDESSITEMDKDIKRLVTVTDRFSKIGSESKKETLNLYEVVDRSISYLQTRVSKKVAFDLQCNDRSITTNLNTSLFEWVIENITKNAVDAMEGKGAISYLIGTEGNQAYIEITDTGKGIPSTHFKTVFEPGYTTKKRGWGLGLSLVKRIVEEHHNGKIYVKSSEIGKGTTFRIELRK